MLNNKAALAPGALAESASGPRRTRSIAAAVIGNFVEFYDWTIYAFMAPIFAEQMFPSTSRFASLLLAFSIFALGYFARPLGALLLGAYGDRIGRRAAMIAAIIVMAGCSLLIGVTPPHAVIGGFAPALIVVARCLQGLAAGGEAGSAQTYLAELATKRRRAVTASLQQVGTGLSTLFALGVSALLAWLLSPAELEEWGWRVPFIVGALIGLVGIYLRVTASETLERRVINAPHERFLATLGQYKSVIFRSTAICLMPALAFFSWQIYLPTYISETTALPRATALGIVTFGTVVFVALISPLAILSDRWGRKPMMLLFAIGALLWAYPTYIGLPTFMHSFGGAVAVAVIGNVIMALMGSTISAALAEAFPTRIRATGVGLAQAIAVVFSGAIYPPLVTALLSQQRYEHIFFFVATFAGIGLVATLTMPETRSCDLNQT